MKNLLIALGILIAAVNPASAGQKYGSLAKIPNVSAWAFVDDNSQRLGFDMQASADYVWSTLDEAGVALDNESPYHLEVSVQSTMLRSIANPASATNTVALMVKIECFKQTNEGMIMYWSDQNFGGYSGVTADYIIEEVTKLVSRSLNDFADAYRQDLSMSSR